MDAAPAGYPPVAHTSLLSCYSSCSSDARQLATGSCSSSLALSQSRIVGGLLSPTPHPDHNPRRTLPSEASSTQRRPRLCLLSQASPLSQPKDRQLSEVTAEVSRQPYRRRTAFSLHWNVHTVSEPLRQPAHSSHDQPRRFPETRTTYSTIRLPSIK